MKVIVLAAGEGTRLRPYTEDRPKCMVPLWGKPLLHHQLEVLKSAGIAEENIALAVGYLKEKITPKSIKQFYNPNYASTNMVESLFSAVEFFEEGKDLIISYGDIVYSEEVLQTLVDTKGDIVVAADLDWRQLWESRMEDPLSDAETFKLENGLVTELGREPERISDIEAQYIGLIKISGKRVQEFVNFYGRLNIGLIYEGRPFSQMYMTAFLQVLIDAGWRIHPAFINGAWIEVDTANDLQLYEESTEAFQNQFTTNTRQVARTNCY